MADLESRMQNEKENPASGTDLENKVDGFYNKSFLGKMVDYTIGIGSMVGAAFLMGPAALAGPTIAVLGDYLINKRNGHGLSSRQFRDTMMIASLLSIPAITAFNLMNAYIPLGNLEGKLTRAVVQTVPMAAAIHPIGLGINYWVRPHENKNAKNMWEEGIKPYYFKNWRDGALYFSIPNQIAANVLSPVWHYPFSRIMQLVGRMTIGQRTLKGLDPYGIHNNKPADNNKPALNYALPQHQYT